LRPLGEKFIIGGVFDERLRKKLKKQKFVLESGIYFLLQNYLNFFGFYSKI